MDPNLNQRSFSADEPGNTTPVPSNKFGKLRLSSPNGSFALRDSAAETPGVQSAEASPGLDAQQQASDEEVARKLQEQMDKEDAGVRGNND